MPKVYDLANKKINHWTVIEKAINDKGKYGWRCICECGNERIIQPHALIAGKTKSCGCQKKPSNLKHGAKCGGKTKRLYRIWQGMKDRCLNQKNVDYDDYGKRGISICEEWLSSYKSFESWANENGYAENLSIDRINFNGNYEPLNCKWANDKQQARNRRNNKYITIDNETKCLSEWVEIYGMNYNLVRSRLNYGWDAEKALTKSSRKKGDKNEFIS